MNIQDIVKNFQTLFQNTKVLNDRLVLVERECKSQKSTIDKLHSEVSRLRNMIENSSSQPLGIVDVPDNSEYEGPGLVDGEAVVQDATSGERYLSPQEVKAAMMGNAPRA